MFIEEIAFSLAADDSSASFSEDGRASIGCTESEKLWRKCQTKVFLLWHQKRRRIRRTHWPCATDFLVRCARWTYSCRGSTGSIDSGHLTSFYLFWVALSHSARAFQLRKSWKDARLLVLEFFWCFINNKLNLQCTEGRTNHCQTWRLTA